MGKYIKLFENHNEYTAFKGSGNFIKPNVSHCVQENDVHYSPLIDNNGHAYVDLGLPSGMLWATMNVGATGETDYGFYFQWGDTSGYTAAQVGNGEGQKYFDWSDYKFGVYSNFTKYNETDGLTTLELSDDAARANWGGNWRMPTKDEQVELISGTTNGFLSGGTLTLFQWSDENEGSLPTETTASLGGTRLGNAVGQLFFNVGVSDYAAAINGGEFIFLPDCGLAGWGSVTYVGQNSYYWSSSLDEGDGSNYPWYLRNASHSNTDYRHLGLSIRGVLTY